MRICNLLRSREIRTPAAQAAAPSTALVLAAPGGREEAFVEGWCLADKDSSLLAQRPTRWATTLRGISGSTAWRDAMRRMLDAAPPRSRDTYLLRETDSPSGDPRDARVWLDGAPTEARAVASLRALLMMPARD